MQSLIEFRYSECLENILEMRSLLKQGTVVQLQIDQSMLLHA